MKQLRKVSKLEKVVFPLLVCVIVGLLLPDAMPLLGMLMLGNLMRESGVVNRLTDTTHTSAALFALLIHLTPIQVSSV